MFALVAATLAASALAAAPAHDMAGMHAAHGTAAEADYVEGSGTSRLPAGEGAMAGLHAEAGDWMLMAHGYAWGVYTDQGGPRGGRKAFVESMAMFDARHDIGGGNEIGLRAMVSLDPLMGDRGYPNLFAAGETAGGRPLVDRQHPHDAFMELSARITHPVGDGGQLFLYAGLPGEPALGPSAFMHRSSARFDPEAPITHHWFDSTHIMFGVVTAGWSTPRWQLEASAFNGRDPGENRWNIERPRLDSWSVRGSWSPGRHWAASLSYGRLDRPERLHPERDEARLIATLSYASGPLAVTAGQAWKFQHPGRTLDAQFVEATRAFGARHALFGHVERVRNDELFEDAPDDPLHKVPVHVAKLTGGYAYSLPLGPDLGLSLGGAVSGYVKPARLDAAYGRRPISLSLFAKLTLGR